MKEGSVEEVTATVSPDNASNKNVTWKSDDSSVATVSEGKIVAVAPGNTVITVTTADGNKTATINVSVSIDMVYRQKKALLALYNSTNGASWTKHDGWNTDADLKDWYGVTMSGNQVTNLKLAKNNLQGNIPESLFELMAVTRMADEAESRTETTEAILSGLIELDLSGNKLSGVIPEGIGNLTLLTTLRLDNNKLTGNLPASLSKLTKLTTLSISHNELDGKIPDEVLESSMWKKIGSKVDLTQDGGKELDDGIIRVKELSLDKTSLDLFVDETYSLTVKITPNDAVNKDYTFSTSDSKIATVDAKGKIKAIKAGTATITVTTKDGNKKTTCTVTIKAKPKADDWISFADANAKAICVEYFDTNGDGELSYAEAAAVTLIPGINFDRYTIFSGKDVIGINARDILYFNELQYFSSLKIIPERMFVGQRLVEVSLPESITEIGGSSFMDCYNLTRVNIPESVTKIWGRAFQNCCALTSIVIPNDVDYIGGYAFSGCSSLTSIEVPKNVKFIAEYTFEGCSNLRNVTMPSGITEICSNAFSDCSSLESIDIPNSLTTIGSSAFLGCSGFTSLIIPSSVTKIGFYAFAGCSNLKSITILNEYPPTVFNDTVYTSYVKKFFYETIPTIYVPVGSVDRYKNHVHWKQYADQIQAIPE
jgi:uncharacterized protein YjdB